ncbi:MAG: elongation factor P 5-aminopentanone reductase [Lachnospiraceae bacterium]
MEKQTLCITGVSRGIGRAIAELFSDGSYNLILNTGTHEDARLKFQKEFLTDHPDCPLYTSCGNVGDPDYVQWFISEGQKRFGSVDILINNAGIAHIGLLSEMTTAQWQKLLNTNLSSVFYTCRAVIPGMVHNKSGRIINISSIWGNTGASCEAAYSATKGGVNTLTKALAKELAPSNIQVNAVSCGVIDTTMNSCFSEEEKAQMAEEIPAGRFGTTQEVARTVQKILEMPSYVTGQILTIDGGFI